MMVTAQSIEDLEAALTPHRRDERIGFVPTMGALHDGHASLISTAAGECGCVVVSDFVNPTQFDDPGDLDSYPRDPERDEALAREAGCTVFWLPTVEEIYPDGEKITVTVDDTMTGVLCGADSSRGSGHFAGVTTVVSRLFDLVAPDIAYFGEKDAQQLAVIRRMVADQNSRVEIRAVPTVRDRDGLALSSRNARLAEEDRERAVAIPHALSIARQAAEDGERSTVTLVEMVSSALDDSGIEAEYVEARDLEDLSEAVELNGRPVVLAVAAEVGGVRLIDNAIIEANGAR